MGMTTAFIQAVVTSLELAPRMARAIRRFLRHAFPRTK